MAVELTHSPQVLRTRFTLAQVNAGATVLPALPGYAYRLIDWGLTAVGGAAATATSVDLIGTRAAAAVRPVVTAVSAMAQSAIIGRGHANSVVLADGGSRTALDANTAVTIHTQAASAGNLATLTHVDVELMFEIISA